MGECSERVEGRVPDDLLPFLDLHIGMDFNRHATGGEKSREGFEPTLLKIRRDGLLNLGVETDGRLDRGVVLYYTWRDLRRCHPELGCTCQFIVHIILRVAYGTGQHGILRQFLAKRLFVANTVLHDNHSGLNIHNGSKIFRDGLGTKRFVCKDNVIEWSRF